MVGRKGTETEKIKILNEKVTFIHSILFITTLMIIKIYNIFKYVFRTADADCALFQRLNYKNEKNIIIS